MNCYYLISHNLDLLLLILHSKGISKISLLQLKKTQQVDTYQGVIVVDQQLGQQSIETLRKLEKIQSSIFIFLNKQNEQSNYLLQKVFNWTQIIDKEIQHYQSIQVPSFMIKYLPKISSQEYLITSTEQLIEAPCELNEIVTSLNLSSSSIDIYSAFQPFPHFRISICSIKKLMQYLFLRTFRDLPND